MQSRGQCCSFGIPLDPFQARYIDIDILPQGVNTVGALVIAFSLIFLISSASSQSTRPQQGQQQLQKQGWSPIQVFGTSLRIAQTRCKGLPLFSRAWLAQH